MEKPGNGSVFPAHTTSTELASAIQQLNRRVGDAEAALDVIEARRELGELLDSDSDVAFTHAEHMYFLRALSILGRGSLHDLALAVSGRTAHEVYGHAVEYLKYLDLQLLEAMETAYAVDFMFKGYILNKRLQFDVSMLMLKNPAYIFYHELVAKSNIVFEHVLHARIDVKDYSPQNIGRFQGVARRFLQYVVTNCGEYAIRNIIFVGLAFYRFQEHQIWLVSTIARTADLQEDFCCAIALSIMCISYF